jgi:ABC-type nitrate/sulfonate/bicarbonate transport system substrate-binding protein
LVAGNVDAAVVPYSFADMAKRGGARSLADAGTIQLPYQGTVFCAPRGSSVVTSEIMTDLTKGLIEVLVYIQDPNHKKDVTEVLKRNLRLSKEEDVESSYNVTRLQMPTLDIAPNLEAWRAIQRLLGRVNPKVQQADLDPILMTNIARSLEASGFLPEMRKKLSR